MTQRHLLVGEARTYDSRLVARALKVRATTVAVSLPTASGGNGVTQLALISHRT
jgi:hypothetical protein